MDGILNDLNFEYLKSLRPKLDPLLKEMHDYAMKNDIPIVSYEVGKLLELMVLIKDPERVLEIGTSIGFSGIFIARALKTRGRLTTLERSAPSVEIANQNFIRAGVSNKIDIVFGDAVKILPEMGKDTRRFDLAFIDAQKEEYQKYLKYTIKIMKHGGVIIVDNLLWHGQTAGGPAISDKYKAATDALKKFNKLFLEHPDLIATILPVGDGTGFAVVK